MFGYQLIGSVHIGRAYSTFDMCSDFDRAKTKLQLSLASVK